MPHLAQVFQDLTEADLKVKIIVLQAHKVEFLGHQISANNIEPNTKNIEAVVTFPIAKKAKVIRSFIRLCTYCRRYIKDFCKIAKPFHILLKKDVKFVWSDQEINIFHVLYASSYSCLS